MLVWFCFFLSQAFRRLFTKRGNRLGGSTTSPTPEFATIGKPLIGGGFYFKINDVIKSWRLYRTSL
uniref:Uncharacterized protein n=1 Tax=Rhizophora mucronata TaxID=61149 RepID=A0A2P2KR05_RHIMU